MKRLELGDTRQSGTLSVDNCLKTEVNKTLIILGDQEMYVNLL